MPPAPFSPQEVLRRFVLRLILMVESALSARVRGRLARELARAEHHAALLADPAFWADPRTAGKAAEGGFRGRGRTYARRPSTGRCGWAKPVPPLEIARCM